MGVSTDGVLSFGVYLGDVELPWDGKDIDEWWREKLGYKPFHDDLWTITGNYAPGYTEAKYKAEYEHERKWDAVHPLPIKMVNACSSTYPDWIAAIPGSVITASRGYPVKIIAVLSDPESSKITALVMFLNENGLMENVEDPETCWRLSSYWGN